ncbi:hypothetical protein N9153_01455 [Planctomicrobium sp.]|jgi:hypothetical protein|nr:hypothetical protein [Planctomicrobium sp.]MDA7503958.1 hypothetical protein [bacterium]MDB4439570.1 hypothetical protein [Planctomicrobium sp.]MDB4731611.1 hypothetical protein [bacterium]
MSITKSTNVVQSGNFEWIDLLSRIQNRIAPLLNEKRNRKRILKAMKEVMVIVVNFADSQFPEDKFDAMQVKVTALYQQIVNIEEKIDYQLYYKLGSVLGFGRGYKTDLEERYQEIHKDSVALIRNVFYESILLSGTDGATAKDIFDGVDALTSGLESVFKSSKFTDLILS